MELARKAGIEKVVRGGMESIIGANSEEKAIQNFGNFRQGMLDLEIKDPELTEIFSVDGRPTMGWTHDLMVELPSGLMVPATHGTGIVASSVVEDPSRVAVSHVAEHRGRIDEVAKDYGDYGVYGLAKLGHAALFERLGLGGDLTHAHYLGERLRDAGLVDEQRKYYLGGASNGLSMVGVTGAEASAEVLDYLWKNYPSPTEDGPKYNKAGLIDRVVGQTLLYPQAVFTGRFWGDLVSGKTIEEAPKGLYLD
jgi:hypothetical protein